jgi:hypothetical protein
MVIGIALLSAPAFAQSRAGIRAGVSGSPDQFFFGAHVETAPLVDHVTFRPNAEIGIGNGLTVVALNLEFAYWIPLHQHPWNLYLGAGPAAVIASHGTPAGNNSSHVGGGFNFLVGAQHRGGLFTELKVGAIDSPNIKFTVGYVFHRR